MNKPSRLGRGLDALLPMNFTESGEEQQTSLPVVQLKPGKFQPRSHMSQAALEELAASIREQGIMQPVLVRPLEEPDSEVLYEIIAGERRWRAAQLAGLAEVPVIIRHIPDSQALAMSLIENIQRENLNPLEEAQGLQRLVDEFNLTHQQAADAVGRSRSGASNLLRLLKLAAPVRDMLMNNDLDMGHARALLAVDEVTQEKLAHIIAAKGLSVRDTEKLVHKVLNQPQAEDQKEASVDPDVLRLETRLADYFGTNVDVRTDQRGGGKIILHYTSLDQLDGIIQKAGCSDEM